MSGIGLADAYKLPDQTAASRIDASVRRAPPSGIGLTASLPASALPSDPRDNDGGLPVPDGSNTVQPQLSAPPVLNPASLANTLPPPASDAPSLPAEAPLIDFHKDPLSAIALVLDGAVSGYRGTESPVDKLKAQKLAEQAQAYKTQSLALDTVDKVATYAMKYPADQRQDIIDHLDARFAPALGGFHIKTMVGPIVDGQIKDAAAKIAVLKQMGMAPNIVANMDPQTIDKVTTAYMEGIAKKASDPKTTVVAPGSSVIDDAGNLLFTAGDKPVQHNVAPGGTVVDSTGKVIYQAPAAASESIAPPTQIGYTGPDGEEVQTAASFDKKTGHYIDAATQKPINNPQNLRVIGNSSGGARSQNVVNRVLTSTEDATSGIENLSRASVKQSKGVFPNLATTPLSALSRTVTPQDIQDYNATNAGLARAMGALATGGMAVDKTTQESFEGLNLNTGDTYITKMRKLAELRQQSQNAIDVQMRSSLLNAEQKTKLKEMDARITKAIPWTVSDVQDLENSNNPGMSLRQAAQARGLGRQAQIPTIATPADASKLPSGTKFKTPDGRILQVP